MIGLDEVVKKLEDLKLCSSPQEMILFTDEPKFPGYFCVPNKEFNIEGNEIFGQGVSVDREYAKVKAIAECIERICFFHPKGIDFKSERFIDNGKFLDPLSFVCLSKEQEDLNDYRNKIKFSKYKWIKGFDHINKKEIFIPGQAVFLSSDFADELVLREQISTGSAMHSNIETALISGFFECLERDAYMPAYLNRNSLKKIDYSNCSSQISKIIAYLKRYNLEPYSFNLTSEDLKIPTVMTITLDRTGIGSAVNIGLRSDFSFENSIKGSILESIQCRRTTRIIKHTMYKYHKINENDLLNMNNRYFYWYDAERIEDLSFWTSTKDYCKIQDLVDISESKRNFSYLRDINKGLNYSLISADITWPEIKNAGFSVHKVIIPEFHPLYLNENMKCLYSKRHGVIKNDKSLKPHPFT